MATFATPTTADVVYGPDPHHRFDHFKHPVRDRGGNPAIIVRHGGGWNTRDKRLVSQDGDELGIFAQYVLSRTGANDTHFDVISIETRQERWDTPVSVSGYSIDEPPTTATYYPGSFDDVKRATVAIKALADTLTIDPDRLALCGSSAGAVMAMWSQVTAPRTAAYYAGSVDTTATRYPEAESAPLLGVPRDPQAIDSRVRAVYAIEPVFDFRLRGSTETVLPSQWRGALGYKTNSTTGAFFAAIPAALRNAISIGAYIEAGQTRGWVPTFCSYATDVFGGTGATWTEATDTVTKVGAFASYAFLATDRIVLYHPTVGQKTLTIASRTSDDAVVTSTKFHTADLTDVQFEVLYGLPYGAVGRDPHNDQDIEKWIAEGTKRGLSIGGRRYSSYTVSDAALAYGFLKGCV